MCNPSGFLSFRVIDPNLSEHYRAERRGNRGFPDCGKSPPAIRVLLFAKVTEVAHGSAKETFEGMGYKTISAWAFSDSRRENVGQIGDSSQV